jgi:hypothetical protein
MNNPLLQDIQKSLNVIRGEIQKTDQDTMLGALELMLSTSVSAISLARKLSKPKIKTVTKTVSIPTTKVVRQEPLNGAVPTLPNQQQSDGNGDDEAKQAERNPNNR